MFKSGKCHVLKLYGVVNFLILNEQGFSVPTIALHHSC
jgi:hypothetical protein